MFTSNWIALAPTRKSYGIGLLLTHKKDDLPAISVTERGCAPPILQMDCHISHRFLPLFIAVWIGIRTVAEVNRQL